VTERGEKQKKRRTYFRGKQQQMSTISKITQTNNTDVFITGGSAEMASLLAREYEIAKSCLKVNLKTGVV